jgi:hypothetical protein
VRDIFILVFGCIFLFSCADNFKDNLYQREEAEQIIKIHLKYNFADEVNTFTKTCTKDLVEDGTVTINFWFQSEAQDTIIRVVEETDFFHLPDTLSYIPEDSIAMAMNPDPGIQSLRISYDHQDKTVYWYIVNSYPSEYERILRITNLIEKIVNADPEYHSLPEPTSGYL